MSSGGGVKGQNAPYDKYRDHLQSFLSRWIREREETRRTLMAVLLEHMSGLLDMMCK
eukprot:gene6688-6407_t